MAKHRVFYADGSLLGQWDHVSERDTALAHSLVGKDYARADVVDDHTFTIRDKSNGVTLFTVSGPPAPKGGSGGDRKPAGDTQKPDGQGSQPSQA